MDKTSILALKLKSYRESHHLTQAQLAELSEVSDKTISKWEQGKIYPSKRSMVKLAEHLDINLEVLLMENQTQTTKSILDGIKWTAIAFTMNSVMLIILNYILALHLVPAAVLNLSLLSLPFALLVGFFYAWHINPKNDKE